MLRVIEVSGVHFETYFDGTFENFQARRVADSSGMISVEVMSQLFAANRYLELVLDLDAEGIVSATNDLLLAAQALETRDYALDLGYQPLASLVNVIVDTGKSLLVPKPKPIKAPEVSAVLYDFAINSVKTVAEFGVTRAEFDWLHRSMAEAGRKSSDFTLARAILEHTDTTGGVIVLDDILTAYSSLSFAIGTANRVRETVMVGEDGKPPKWIDESPFTNYLRNVGEALTQWVPTDIDDWTVEALFADARLLENSTDLLSNNGLEAIDGVEKIRQAAEAFVVLRTTAAEAELYDAMQAFFEPALPQLPLDRFEQLLVDAGPRDVALDGFSRVTDLEGDSIEDATPLQFERLVDGSIKAKLDSDLSRYDVHDVFSFDASEGEVIRFSHPGVSHSEVLDATGATVTTSYSSGRYTTAPLEAGTHYLRLINYYDVTQAYELDVQRLNTDLLEPDDYVTNPTDLGTLAVGQSQVQDQLGGTAGLDLVDHYRFTLDAPSRVVVTLTGDGGGALLRLDHPDLFRLYRDEAIVATGALDAGIFGSTLSLSAGTYTMSLEGDGTDTAYTLSFDVAAGFGGDVATVSSGTPAPFGDGDDVITQNGGYVQTRGGRDMITFNGTGNLDAGDQDDRVILRGWNSVPTIFTGGNGTDTLVFDGPARFRMGYVDANGDALSLGNSVADFLSVADSSAGLVRNVYGGYRGNTLLPVSTDGFENFEVWNNSGKDSVVIWTPGLRVLDASGSSNFYADWRGISDSIIWDAAGLRGGVDLSVPGVPKSATIALGDGADIWAASIQYLRLDTGGGDDEVTASGTISLGDGDDTITGGGTLDLGAGDDLAILDVNLASVDGAEGFDTAAIDLKGAYGGYYYRSYMYMQVADGAGGWTRPSGTALELLDQVYSVSDWRLEMRASSYNSQISYASIQNIEELHLGGGRDGNLFIAVPELKSVNGYGSGTFLADWQDASEAISNVLQDGTAQYSNGVSVTDVDRTIIRTGAGDDSLIVAGEAFTGAGDDTVTLLYRGLGLTSFADTGDGNDRIIAKYGAAVHAGAGNDQVTIESDYDGTYDGGTGIDWLSLSLASWRWIDETLTEHVVGNLDDLDAMTAHYTADGEILAARSTNRTGVSGFERIDQTGDYNGNALIDFGHGSILDGQGGNDALLADWSDTTQDVVLDFTIDDWQTTPGGGSLRNMEFARIRTGSGNDELRLFGGSNDVFTGAGNDFVRQYSGTYGTGKIGTGVGNDVVLLKNQSYVTEVELGVNNDWLLLENSAATGHGGWGTDTVVLRNMSFTPYLIEQDGSQTVINSAETHARFEALQGTNTAFRLLGDRTVTLSGFERAVIWGGSGDHLYDIAQNSLIRGHDGGREYITLGGGNDIAQGMGGSDYYYLRAEFGSDLIQDYSGGDRVYFLDTVATDLSFAIDGDDLTVAHTNGSHLRIAGYVAQNVAGRGWQFYATDGAITLDVSSLPGAPITASGAATVLDDLPEASDGPVTLISGGSGDDFLRGTAGRDSISGKAGDDVIETLQGEDTVDAGDGDDWITVGLGHAVVDGGAGNDVLNVRADQALRVDLTTGTLGTRAGVISNIENVNGHRTLGDYVVGDDHENRIITFGGRDRVDAGDGDDKVATGSEDDTIDAGAGNDLVRSGSGNDQVVAGNGRDTIETGDGNDTIDASGGDAIAQGTGDVILPGKGEDVIIGHASAFARSGGGLDLSFADQFDTRGLVVTLNDDGSGTADSLRDASVRTVFTFVDAVVGSFGNDSLIGAAGAQDLNGGSGDDQVWGMDGADTVHGAYGRDTLDGGAGNDLLFGDGQDDTVHGGAGNDRLEAGFGADSVNGGSGNDTLSGDGGADMLIGGNNNDRLRGDNGNDTLFGGSGKDRLFGGNHADLLVGGFGNDILKGGAGDDTLSGGGNNDRMAGGTGSDAFVFSDNFGDDTITGFVLGEDRLVFETGFEVRDFAGFIAACDQVGAHLVYDLDGDGQNRIQLNGIDPAKIDGADVVFL